MDTLKRLIQILLTLPVSNASSERSFSCLRRVKTWLRSTMNQDRLNSIAIVGQNRHINITSESIVEEFSILEGDLIFVLVKLILFLYVLCNVL